MSDFLPSLTILFGGTAISQPILLQILIQIDQEDPQSLLYPPIYSEFAGQLSTPSYQVCHQPAFWVENLPNPVQFRQLEHQGKVPHPFQLPRHYYWTPSNTPGVSDCREDQYSRSPFALDWISLGTGLPDRSSTSVACLTVSTCWLDHTTVEGSLTAYQVIDFSALAVELIFPRISGAVTQIQPKYLYLKTDCFTQQVEATHTSWSHKLLV